ncbi:MAG: type II toxin-antitoxin system RelE/ParE family toxin [Deltaproteobacteria bacterium]|nr:type II toxin-antitoxin system RelE/ParE family toxin [Deltaproteobacteria bacterium]
MPTFLPLSVEPEAEEELAEAVDWYEAREPGLGAALFAEVDAAVFGLRRRELPGVTVPHVRAELPVRRVLLARFPYAVVFLDASDELHVLAVAHHRRRPGYWRDRLRRRRRR